MPPRATYATIAPSRRAEARSDQFSLELILEFFSEHRNWDILNAALDRRHAITLRLLEFTLENAARVLGRDDLHGIFLTTLFSRGKSYFDSFRRHVRLRIGDPNTNDSVETNVAQMRFLYVAINSGVYAALLVPKTRAKAERAMRAHLREIKRRRRLKKRSVVGARVTQKGVEKRQRAAAPTSSVTHIGAVPVLRPDPNAMNMAS